MTVKLEDRPIEQVREETIDKLIVNYSHGVISADAFERRLDTATYATEHQVLVDLVADLSMEADSQYDRYKEKQFTPKYQSGDDESNERLITVLSNSERTGQWIVPKQITVYGLLGSAKLDFTDAVFQHQHVEIKVVNGLSSLEIFVPENINVSTRLIDIISSSENTAPSMGGRQAPTISVTGWSVLSSVEVTVKQTMKEKFVAFANSIKATFNSQS